MSTINSPSKNIPQSQGNVKTTKSSFDKRSLDGMDMAEVLREATAQSQREIGRAAYRDAVDEVLSIKGNKRGKSKYIRSLISMGTLPNLYQKFGFDTSLPLLITSRHIQAMGAADGDDVFNHAHGISPETIKQLSEALDEPAFIIRSKSRPEDCIVVVTTLTDRQNNVIVAAICASEQVLYDSRDIEANIMLSAYGKDDILKYVKQAYKENRMLEVNEKGGRQLQIHPGVQFPDAQMYGSLNHNIHQFKQSVKSEICPTPIFTHNNSI